MELSNVTSGGNDMTGGGKQPSLIADGGKQKQVLPPSWHPDHTDPLAHYTCTDGISASGLKPATSFTVRQMHCYSKSQAQT